LKGEVPPKWSLDEDASVAIVGVEGCVKNSPSFCPFVERDISQATS
jgi:hypothetical protein